MKIPVPGLAAPSARKLTLGPAALKKRPPAFEDRQNDDEQWLLRCEHDYLVEAQNHYVRESGARLARLEGERSGGRARGLRQDFMAAQEDLVGAIMEASPMSEQGRALFLTWVRKRAARLLEYLERFEREQLLLHARALHQERLEGIIAFCEADADSFADACEQLEEAYNLAVGQGLYQPEEAFRALEETRAWLASALAEALAEAEKDLEPEAKDGVPNLADAFSASMIPAS